MGNFIENNSFVMSQAEHSTNVLIFDLLNYNNILIFKSIYIFRPNFINEKRVIPQIGSYSFISLYRILLKYQQTYLMIALFHSLFLTEHCLNEQRFSPACKILLLY